MDNRQGCGLGRSGHSAATTLAPTGCLAGTAGGAQDPVSHKQQKQPGQAQQQMLVPRPVHHTASTAPTAGKVTPSSCWSGNALLLLEKQHAPAVGGATPAASTCLRAAPPLWPPPSTSPAARCGS